MILAPFLLFVLAQTVFAQQARVITSCTTPNTAAISLDDGPFIYEKDVVDTADAAGAKVTFFVNGRNYGCIYDFADSLQYAYNKGHQIAGHTWDHKDLTKISRDEIQTEFSRLDEALQRILGIKPAFMRPPFGNYNDDVLNIAGAAGETVVTWDFDPGDSTGEPAWQSIQDYGNIVSEHPGSILTINHETHEETAHQVIPKAIWSLKNAGYKLVTVAECVGEQPYQWVGSFGVRNDSWVC